MSDGHRAARLRRDRTAARGALICLLVALAAPLLIFAAAVGVRMGHWDWRFGLDLLTLKLGLGLAGMGVLAALVSLIFAARAPKSAGLIALAAVLIAAGTAAGFARHFSGLSGGFHGDVSSDPGDPPAFGGALAVERGRATAGGVAPAGACVLAPVTSQAAPGAAGYALQQAGFEIRSLSVGRADGVRTSFWFGLTHDAVIRIRPGRTDVRVAARQARDDGGEACRLARRILAELQPR